jgi:hypothetical protein
MRLARNVRSVSVLLALAVGAAICGAAVASTGEGCGAEIDATLESRQDEGDGERLRFAIAVEAEASCAEVTYDLVLVELLPNQQWKSVRLSGRAEVQDGRGSARVEHVVAREIELIEHEARVVACRRCDASD